MYLVGFNCGWADEFDVYGLGILEHDQYMKLLDWSKSATYYFGTNEGWEDEDLSSCFTILTSNEDEILTVKKILPFRDNVWSPFPTYGNFPFIEDFEDDTY